MLPLLTWLIQGAVGPALVGLPVTWAATDLTEAARRWFRHMRKSDGLSRIVCAAAGGLDLSDTEFAAVRRLLEKGSTWAEVGRGTVEDLAILIASCLPGQDRERSLTSGRAVARGLLEFAVRGQPGPVHNIAGDLRPLLFGEHPVLRGGPDRAVPHRPLESVRAQRGVWLLEQPSQATEVAAAILTQRWLQLIWFAPPGDQVRVGMRLVAAGPVQVVQQPSDPAAAR